MNDIKQILKRQADQFVDGELIFNKWISENYQKPNGFTSAQFYGYARDKILKIDKNCEEWKEFKEVLKKVWKAQQENNVIVRFPNKPNF